MGFFEDVDNISILERHADRLEGVEMSQARKMLKEYKKAREQIKLQLLANSFNNEYSEAKMKNALAQIEASISLLRKKIGFQIQEGFDFLSSQGIEDSVTEMDAFDKAFGGGFGKLPF
jgi:YesN/AraC family two-component response regulator